jgi:hypothetical protein
LLDLVQCFARHGRSAGHQAGGCQYGSDHGMRMIFHGLFLFPMLSGKTPLDD